MLQKTKAIVLRLTKYGDTSIIVTMFTELLGLQSYIVNGVRSKTARNKIALYQPLTLLEMVVYYRPQASIHRIKEIKCLHPYGSVSSDIRKSAIAIFLTELLNKTLRDDQDSGTLFNFIADSMIIFDQQEGGENFHIIFMLKLARHLGFGVRNVHEVTGPRVLGDDEEQLLNTLLRARYDDAVVMTTLQRRAIVQSLLIFYANHIEGFGEMKSLQVLREVLS